MMGMQPREPRGSFIYEPSFPPSIPPDVEIAEWRARRSQDL
jgi:hypothetical protein